MNRKPYTRPLSLPERAWIVYDKVCPPYLNQMVLEGNGAFIDKKKWEVAVREASEANPGSRLVLKGWFGAYYWVDTGKSPLVREVDGSNWSGSGYDNALFLKESLCPFNGPTCEILLVHGDPLRIVFRTHHGVMDGRGTLTWVEDIFRVLRNEAAIGAHSTITDIQMAKTFQTQYRKAFPRDNLSLTGKANSKKRGTQWCRKRIVGHYPNLLQQVAVQMAKEARRHSDGRVWIFVPVDLRHRMPKLRSTANLSSAIYLEVSSEATAKQLVGNMWQQLRKGYDGLLFDRWDFLYGYVPICMLRLAAQQLIKTKHLRNKYSYTGIISNFGKVPLNSFTGGGFKPDTGFFIPPGTEYSPSMIALAENNNAVEMTLTIPCALGDGKRMETAIDNIAAGLKPVKKGLTPQAVAE